jgi:hypothetical protein
MEQGRRRTSRGCSHVRCWRMKTTWRRRGEAWQPRCQAPWRVRRRGCCLAGGPIISAAGDLDAPDRSGYRFGVAHEAASVPDRVTER